MAFDYDEKGTPIGAAGGFDYDESGNPVSADKPAERTFGGTVKDIGISALKSAISVPEAAVGLADIPTGGAVGNLVESAGVRFKEAKRILDEELSPAQQAANRRVDQADGFFPTIGALLANPSVIAHGAIESLGSMGAGGVVGRGVVAAAPKVAPWIAAAIGEGSITAGSMAESTRQTTGDLTAAQSAMSIASGIGTGALGAIGGRLAKRLGVDDVDTMLVKGIAADASEDAAVATVKKGIVRRILEGGLSEGVFEELPQSAQEQVWQNAALGKPLMEGVDKAAAQGMLVGAAMGGGGNLIGSLARPAPTVDDIAAAPTTDDAIAAADAALAAPIDTLAPAIDAFKSEWSAAAEAARVPADSAIPMVGMPEQPTAAQPTIALPTDAAPAAQQIVTPDRPAGPALIALAEQLAILPAGEQTKALMRLDADMRQRVVQTMRALDPAVPSGIVTPDAGVQPGQGEAARITNEATVAASSVQPVVGTAVTNVPAYTQRAAQEIVSKDPSQEMRPHREVAGRFEVVPVISAAGPARGVFSTQPAVTEQQRLADEESPATATPAAPAARPAVPAAPLTAEQTAANQAAADAERSSQPRPIFGPQSQLRSETGPDIKGEKVTRNMRKVLVQMGRITGTKVVFEFAPGSSDGAVPNRSENTVHINTAAQINPMQVMGHEVTHVLRDRHAKAWASVRDALVATMPDKRKALDAFAADYWGGNAENKAKLAAARAMPDWSAALTPEQKELFHTSETVEAFLLDEMVSDLGGQHWSDEKFWLDVFAKIEKQEGDKARGIIERMVMAIRETLGKFLAVVRAQKQGDYATISPEQIEATRDAISSAYAAFIRGERTVEPDQGEHTTEHRINTSRTHSRSQGAEGEPAVLETDDELSDARARELAALSPARAKRDQRLFFEVAPNPNDKTAVAAWKKRTDKQKRDVSNDVVSRIIPGLLADLHVTGKVVTQLGGWMDDTNPSFALVVSAGDPLLTARAIGYVLDQEAVYALGLKPFTGAEKTGIIHIDIAGKDAHKIYMQIRALNRDAISGHSTIGNEMLIGLPIDLMNSLEQDIDNIARKEDVLVSLDEGYGATIKEYGYGIRDEARDSRKQRTEARDVDKWRTEARAATGGRSNAAGRGSDRAGVARKSEQRPSYGEGSGEQVVGVHYSRQQRDTLSSAHFGTGMKAQERFRIAEAKDPRIKKRLYFYANTGKGIAPESDVGHHAHSVTLNNVYDMDVDPKRLYKRLAEGDPYQSPDNLMNDFESGVIDAGFDGYMTREFGKGGAVVLLGAHSVPVQYEGERARPDVPTMPAPKFSDEQKLRRKLAENRALPAGQMTGLEWKRALMREMPELDPRWLDNNKMYRRDELIPRSEPARLSESRPVTWWYSPLARQAESAQMKKAPASGWKSWLKSLAAKGVKPDEIKWSGIEEWLDAQGEAQVTREQVQAYLSEFGVKIETILRGERSPVTDTTQDSEDEDYDIELNVGDWETDDPDEDWLSERASDRFDEELENRVEQEYQDQVTIVWDQLLETDNGIASHEDYYDDIRRDAGDMFQLSDAELRAEGNRRLAIDRALANWQHFADDPDTTLEDEDAVADAMDRAFAVASGDIEALETEARRRARAEIDDDRLLDELTEQERTWYYDDYDSPQTRRISVDGVDGTFWDSTSYGERQVYFDGRELTLPLRADDADVEGAIRQFVMEEGLVSGSSGGSDSFRAVKWEGYATDKSRAVPGSYREVQLTLPVGAFGMPKTRMREEAALNYYDDKGDLIGTTINEDRAKERAENMGGRVEPASPVQTARVTTSDFYYTTHWQEANVIGHARFDEHTDSDGKRVLVLQEVQGDWGQQRREGLEAQEKADEQARKIEAKKKDLREQGADVDGNAELSAMRAEYDRLERNASDDIPDAAPFIEKTAQWAGLVLKRMIAHAVEAGFDKVVWTSGAQQVERWRNSLRKQVDTIAWEKTAEGIHIVASQNGRQRTDTRVSETALSDAIGKQMAKQIIADPNQSGEITGDDITISDTGMAGFYDRMLPNIANDILRKFDKDVRVKEIEVHEAPAYTVVDLSENGGRGFSIADWNGKFVSSKIYNTSWSGDTRADAEARIEQMQAEAAATAITTQQGFEITDKLRESAAAGMPLFSQRRASAEARKSEARKEWYRSQLSEAVGGLPAKVRTGKEAALWLQSNSSKLQVKKDELQWSGVLDWLATQRSVTGAQIQDWLASNGVRVRTVMFGEESAEYRRLDAEMRDMDAEIDRLRKSVMDGKIGAAREYGEARDRKNELFEQRKAARGEQVKWDRADLNIAGGKNYRELLLTLPKNEPSVKFEDYLAGYRERFPNSRADEQMIREYWQDGHTLPTPGVTSSKKDPANFYSSHYPQPNILAHVRFDERTDADGKRVLFIQEVQSDWAQAGRKDGFKQPVQANGLPQGFRVIKEGKYFNVADSTGDTYADRDTPAKTEQEAIDRALKQVQAELGAGESVPNTTPAAPFVTDTKSWVSLALKRAISHAVDNGFDRVAWTTGEQQVARYSLDKQVNEISWRVRRGNKNVTVELKGGDQLTFHLTADNRVERIDGTGETTYVGKPLDEVIGKEVTAKIIAADDGRLAGDGLKIGGEGMVAFYDGIVKQVARSLGATVGTVNLPNPYRPSASGMTMAEADANMKVAIAAWKPTQPQPGFDITDKMREQAAIGMPLFSEPRKPLDRWLGNSKVRTVMYHGTARDIKTFRPQQADAIFLTDDPEFAADFADLSHSWMVNNFWTWMTPEQIQEAKRDAMRMLLQDALPGSSLYMREERLLNQSQQPSQYMRRAVEQYMPSESNIMPLYVRAENPFDYRNPQHVQQIEQLLGGSWMGHEFINGEMVEVAQHIGDLERGDWNAIESEKVQAYIRANHDSFYVRERGVTNLAVFSPNQVKSASGNDGSYSREDNDIRRSERRIDAAIAAVYKDDRLYEALDFGPSNNSGPFDGGCLICAKALIRAFGGGDLVRIVRSNNDMTDHYGARIDGTIYDFLGSASSPAAWLARFKREEHITHKQHFAEGYDSQSDIPDDPAAEKKIAALLTAAADVPRQSTPRSRTNGQPINQSWTDPDVTDWDDFVRKMQDDKIDTKRVLRAIRDAGVAVKEKFDAYLLETNYHGRAAARVDAFADGELRKLMEDMAMRKLTMADLDDYLWARHAPERNAANNRSNPAITDGSGMSDAQSAAILAGQAVTVGARTIQLSPAALRAAQAVASRVDTITSGTLDLLVSSGLETQQTVDTWKRTYAHYAPLKRDMESDANYSGAFGLGNGTGTGFSVRGAASKRALGSKRAVTDVLANIAMQRERAITRSEKNRVAQAVYGLALSAPNPEFWIPVNPELNKKLSPTALQAAIAELVAIGVNPLDAKNLAYEPVQRYTDPKTGLEMQRINPQLRGRDDVLSTRINGEERYVFFSNKKRAQEMVRGLKNLDAASVSGALQVIAPVTRWFASINTQYNPIFGMTNGIRDFSTGMLNLSSTPLSSDRAAVAKYAFDALRGVYADLRDHRAGKQPTSQWAQLFEQFAMDGGKTGYRDAFATSTDRAEAIAKELEHAGKGKQWVIGGEKHSAVFGWLSDYNTAVENAMRLSAYKVALDKGMSRDAAASLAKNLTVNFNKKGLAATQTGALYAFFNAAVQGTARMGETTYKDGKLTDAGKKILYGGMMLGVLQAMLGAAAGWDDDEPPQFQREKNFIIPILGTDKIVNVPMPLGFHVIPNIGRITAEWMMGGFKDPGKRLVRLAGLMLDAFNPIGSGTLAQTLSPTIGDPIIALGENKDWTGKSIYKEDFNKMHPTAGWTRTKDSASPPSRWLSYGINYITGGGKYEIGMASPTPDQLDYLVGQATGGVGRELLKTAQYVSGKVTGEELPLYKTPLGVGRFVGETKGQSSETGRFYRNLERIGEHKSALEAMKDDGNGEAMRAYLAEHPDARLVQVADRAQREIGYLRRQKREVIAKGGNPERVKMLEERITSTTRRYNEIFKSR